MRNAFTLIEMLVVLAVIGILAALLLTGFGNSDQRAMIARAQAELNQVEAAIEAYKAKMGAYPPDNPGNPLVNQLYFELAGTVLNKGTYVTVDGSHQIAVTDVPPLFGANVTGFANVSKSTGGGGDGAPPYNFLKGFKASQVGTLATTGNALLVCSVTWPEIATQPVAVPLAAVNGLNPWRYVSAKPTNNPNSFDLWVDLLIKGKIYRISNWSKQPLLP